MRDTHTDLRTFYDGCDLTLRYDGGTAHFELWVPGEATPEPLATIPAIGGELEWTPSADDLLEHYDEGREEMIPVVYAEDIRHLIDSYAALQGDRRGYTWNEKWCAWEVSDENDPLVIARDGEQLDLVTPRNDRKAGAVGWRLHWDGDEHSAPSDGAAQAVYYLVETCSQQYSMYGTQVWRIEGKEVTHDAWFAWGSDDPAKAVKKLCDVYVVAGEDGAGALPPVDPDSLRVVESDNACCFLVY